MADAYVTWEDLLDAPDEEAAGPPAAPAALPPRGGLAREAEPHAASRSAPVTMGGDPPYPPAAPVTAAASGPPLPEGVTLPEEVRRLFAEREVLERRLKVLAGQAPPPEEQDAHLRARFPVKVHTKESRIEERRLNLRDQLRQMTTKRLQESVLVARRQEAEREREAQAQRDDAARRERVRRQLDARQRAWAEELDRRRIETERARARWAAQRAASLQRVHQVLRRDAAVEAARAEEQRRVAEARIVEEQRRHAEDAAGADERRRQQQAALVEDQRRRADEQARADEQRRQQQAALVEDQRRREVEQARADEQRQLKEAAIAEARRQREVEQARADEQRRLKEAALAGVRRQREQQDAEARLLRTGDEALSGRAQAEREMETWEKTRAAALAHAAARRKQDRAAERRRFED